MNKGFVVGKVYTNYGKPKSGAEVMLLNVEGGVTQFDLRNKSLAPTNSKGQFSLPFEWAGTGFGDDASVISMTLAAKVEHQVTASYNSWTIGRANTRGFLMKDTYGLMKVPLNNILEAVKNSNIPDILNFIKDFIEGYRRFSSYPFYKTETWTTETWLLLGGVDIFLNDSPYD